MEKSESRSVNVLQLLGVTPEEHVIDEPLEAAIRIARPLEALRGVLEQFVEAIRIVGIFEPGDLVGLLLHFDPQCGADEEEPIELPLRSALFDIPLGQPSIGLDFPRFQVEVPNLGCRRDLSRKAVPHDHFQGEHDLVEGFIEKRIGRQKVLQRCLLDLFVSPFAVGLKDFLVRAAGL